MNWLASFFIALLTGVAAMFACGYIASLAVDWYHITGREGASGYFVVAYGFWGLVGGVILGIVVSRFVGVVALPSFFKALGISLGIAVALIGAGGGAARLLADVPPEIDGKILLLAVEVRWPADQATSPATEPAEFFVRLHSIPRFSHTVRASERGPLWKEDAHLVDGRWVVPGAVNVFTSRGTRMLEIATGGKRSEGFLVPLPAYPKQRDLQWSDWLPRVNPGAPASPNRLTYRYRAQPWTEPIRTETIGLFDVQTIASWFYDVQVSGQTTSAATAKFAIRYRGQPFVIEGRTRPTTDSTGRFDFASGVAVLPGPEPALLVNAQVPQESDICYLLTADGERVRVDYVAVCANSIQAAELTSDTARFRAIAHRDAPRGRIDRTTFANGGLFLMGFSLLDSRRHTVHRFTTTEAFTEILSVPPLGLSPDERSFVRYAQGPESKPALVVRDFVADRSYTLPIDPVRMRFAKYDALDPWWVAHHFAWERGRDGVDRLVERAHFVPLPYHGELTELAGGYRTYRLEKAGESVRGALIDFLVAEFKAERLPFEAGAWEYPVRIDGHVIKVACSNDNKFVSVSMDPSAGTADTSLVATIARRFDAELATGRHDALFEK